MIFFWGILVTHSFTAFPYQFLLWFIGSTPVKDFIGMKPAQNIINSCRHYFRHSCNFIEVCINKQFQQCWSRAISVSQTCPPQVLLWWCLSPQHRNRDSMPEWQWSDGIGNFERKINTRNTMNGSGCKIWNPEQLGCGTLPRAWTEVKWVIVAIIYPGPAPPPPCSWGPPWK